MLRTVLAVLIPVIVWGALWVASNAGLAVALPDSFTDAGAPQQSATGVLFAIIAISIALSFGAGALAARIATHRRLRTVWILATVQLAIGILVQASAWSHFPLWYHILFLGFVIPAHVTGGRVAGPASAGA